MKKLVSAALIALASLLGPFVAQAADWYVSYSGDNEGAGTADDPFETLHHAVAHANSGDTIRLLDDAEIGAPVSYTGTLTIEGYSDGNEEPVSLESDDWTTFLVSYNSFSSLTLRRINFGSTLTEGNDGGSIYTAGYLRIEDCTFTSSYSGGRGGAIYCRTLTATRCVFDACSAYEDGGAVYATINADIQDCTFDRCISEVGRGGAIFSGGGTFIRSEFSYNGCYAGGGGIYSDGDELQVESCRFEWNDSSGSEGGAICSDLLFLSKAKIVNSTFARNDGASSVYIPCGNSLVEIRQCRFLDEFSDAAIRLEGVSILGINIENVWIDNVDTGMVFDYPTNGTTGDVVIRHCTIEDTAAGIRIENAAPDRLSFSIFNSILWCGNALEGEIHTVSAAYSVISDLESLPLDSSTACLDADPALSNGHLGDDSPCIDMAAAHEAVAIDCDGNSRPRGNGYDVGAFESNYRAELDVLPDSISESCKAGEQASHSITVYNDGAGWLEYHVMANVSWIDGLPFAGTLFGVDSATIFLSLSAVTLEPGTYSGQISISAARGGNQAINSPFMIPVTFTVGASEPDTVQITTSATPWNGGTTSGGGAKPIGASCTVVATPADGYAFSNWSEGGTVVSTSASYTFTATRSHNLTANFAAIPPPTYMITTTSSPAEGGTTVGGGSKQRGSSCTVVATPANGYAFSNWTEGGTVVSMSASYTFSVTRARTLHANFAWTGGGTDLPPPTGLWASVGLYTDRITLSWQLVAGATHYRVYRASSPTGAKTALGGWQTNPWYHDYTAPHVSTWHYFVKAARDASGMNSSSYSSAQAGYRRLPPPVGIWASDGKYNDRVTVSWNAVEGANYYRVWRATSPTGTKFPLGGWRRETFYKNYNSIPARTYYYFIQAARTPDGWRPSRMSNFDSGWRAEVPRLDTYLVIDLAGGPTATSYPVSYRRAPPSGGWTDEYKTTKLVLRRIAAGTFVMGALPEEPGYRPEEEAQRQVVLSRDFYMGVFEVTQRQWERVMGRWPSYFSNPDCREKRPVETVSYFQIRENPDNSAITPNWPESSQVHADSFMGRLRRKTGLRTLDLPTSRQWEYACRAGTATALNSGRDLTNQGSCPNLSRLARYKVNSGNVDGRTGFTSVGTAPVGSYLPNAWGLYDFHGNVWERCLDSGWTREARMVRGGSWNSNAAKCRSAYWNTYYSNFKFNACGFRVATLE